ncbi:MAG: hypothetical protein ACP5M1_12880 [Acidiphilium sp.]
MNDPINLESGQLFYADLLRDGGSAIIIIDMTTHQISLRVMRSIAEQTGPHHNAIEISINNQIIKRVTTNSAIIGLDAFLRNNHDQLDPRVIAAFASARR